MGDRTGTDRHVDGRFVAAPPPECHPDRPHQAKGMCNSCYRREYKRLNPDTIRKHRKLRKERYPEKQREYDLRAKAKARAADPQRQNDLRTAYRYKLTLDEYRALIARPCAACGAPSTDIDHDHNTGAIRDPLCGGCNRALGAINDDPTRLLALVAYLEKHGITAKEAASHDRLHQGRGIGRHSN
jgi:hypothetical protein